MRGGGRQDVGRECFQTLTGVYARAYIGCIYTSYYYNPHLYNIPPSLPIGISHRNHGVLRPGNQGGGEEAPPHRCVLC